MTNKTKKVLNIVVNVIVVLILVLVLILTVNIIASGNKGYTSLFGNAYVSVQTDSMDGDKPDSFKPGDLLKVKILSEKEKNELEPDDVIMFYDRINERIVLNSHRIIEINGEGEGRTYVTKGDNTPDSDKTIRTNQTIVGKVISHTNGLGKVTDWFNSQTGFGVCVVLPSLLVVAYCVYNLVKAVKERNKETAADKEALMKEQILEQLRAEGKLAPEEAAAPVEQSTPAADAEKENEKSDDAK